MPRFEPAPQIESRGLRRIGGGEAAGDEAEAFCLRAYCVLKG